MLTVPQPIGKGLNIQQYMHAILNTFITVVVFRFAPQYENSFLQLGIIVTIRYIGQED